jgi:hypothetical protein
MERGFEIDHSTINRWVLAYAPEIEKRLRQFRLIAVPFGSMKHMSKFVGNGAIFIGRSTSMARPLIFC